MKGFKDTTKTCYATGGRIIGPAGPAKTALTMHQFKQGAVHLAKAPPKASGLLGSVVRKAMRKQPPAAPVVDPDGDNDMPAMKRGGSVKKPKW